MKKIDKLSSEKEIFEKPDQYFNFYKCIKAYMLYGIAPKVNVEILNAQFRQS